jgi:hypothetical protein
MPLNKSGGTAKYYFDIILFSKTPAPQETKAAVLDVLQKIFGSTQMKMADPPLFYYEFEGLTGINEDLAVERSEVVYSIQTVPEIIKDTSLSTDKRLTILEGLIGNAFLEARIDVSLIKGSHGTRPEVNSTRNNYYKIGLCTPACSDYKKNLFNSYIMKGGGSWDEYCYCCGLPFGIHHYSVEEDTYSLVEERKLIKAELKEIKETGPKITELMQWLNTSIGLDSHHNLIFKLKGGGDSGNMLMASKQNSPGAQRFYDTIGRTFVTGDMVTEMAEEDKIDEGIGLAIHKACALVLEEAINRPLKPSDEAGLRAIKTGNARDDGPCFKPYNQQFYAWADALLNEPAVFFSDPSKNEARKAQILKCTASFIKAAKAGGKRKTRKNHSRRIYK